MAASPGAFPQPGPPGGQHSWRPPCGARCRPDADLGRSSIRTVIRRAGAGVRSRSGPRRRPPVGALRGDQFDHVRVRQPGQRVELPMPSRVGHRLERHRAHRRMRQAELDDVPQLMFVQAAFAQVNLVDADVDPGVNHHLAHRADALGVLDEHLVPFPLAGACGLPVPGHPRLTCHQYLRVHATRSSGCAASHEPAAPRFHTAPPTGSRQPPGRFDATTLAGCAGRPHSSGRTRSPRFDAPAEELLERFGRPCHEGRQGAPPLV